MTENWQRIESLDHVSWPQDCVLIVDETVAHLAPEALAASTLRVTAGESLKRLSSVEELANRVLELRATRPLTIVAMGGGSVGDAVGFLASVLWRGVKLWHVPTTLLAAVDSAHGGKTAVNLGHAKNQLGTFYPAERVLFADDFLRAMPLDLRAAGMTELVKGLWLGDADGLDLVDEVGVDELVSAPYSSIGSQLGVLLDRAVAVKHEVVRRDPFETKGIRTWLNLGHTAGHALELLSGASHGIAVAWGMAAAARVSEQRGLLDPEQAERLWQHVFPLMGGRALHADSAKFRAAVRRDKKTIGGKLRSVLLQGPAEPVVTDEVSAGEWEDAVDFVREHVFGRSIAVSLERPRPSTVRLGASKSELNRALTIAALRGEEPSDAWCEADDVVYMKAGIAALKRGEVAHAGEGGTTFRFLSAVAVAQPGGGSIEIGEQLARRPHGPLMEAYRKAGVTVERDENRFRFGELPSDLERVEVDASASSQFASALVMLRAARPNLQVETVGEVASRGYFDMTLRMLEMEPLRVTCDASSAVIWRVLSRLGVPAKLAEEPGELQPDSVAESLLWAPDQAEKVIIDVGGAPDLVPVFAAYAAVTEPAVELRGAPHLRHKESNRIDDLVAAFAEVGVTIDALDDGVAINAGRQAVDASSTFDPRGDHRLVFAAVVLATTGLVTIDNPRCAAKSYPGVFQDLRAAGFTIRALAR